MIAVGIGLIGNPKIKGTDELEQITGTKKPSSEEVSVELPEKSAAEILRDLANPQFPIRGNQISDDDQETVLTFGKAFVNLYSGAIAEQQAVSFKNYISNENLLKFTNKMFELEQRKELKGGIGVIFGLKMNSWKQSTRNLMEISTT